MNKCYIFKNESDTQAELFIYGDITRYEFFDNDKSAKTFADELRECGSKDIILHINSGGGDVFEAVAMHNCLKDYPGNVFVSIEGICASAATIVACAGNKVSMADNSLYMIHNVCVGLGGYFDINELLKVQASLSAVGQTIISTYKNRTGKDEEEISNLMNAETWYTAQEALDNNFIDEIKGSIESKYDAAQKILFVNKLNVDCRKFNNDKISKKVVNVLGNDKNFWEKLKAALSSKSNNQPSDPAQIRAQESARISALNNLRSDNAAANAIIDTAISDGKTVDEIQKYIDAVKAVPDIKSQILKLIDDNLNSGAEGVTDSVTPNISESDKINMTASLIAKFAK